jgi:hypothetical protein
MNADSGCVRCQGSRSPSRHSGRRQTGWGRPAGHFGHRSQLSWKWLGTPQPQPIPAQQQHGPVLPDSTNQYFELSTATGRVFKHTVRDTAEYFDNTINSKGSIETESTQVRIEYQGPDRQCYWRLYTETITNNRTTHFVDDGIEPVVD